MEETTPEEVPSEVAVPVEEVEQPKVRTNVPPVNEEPHPRPPLPEPDPNLRTQQQNPQYDIGTNTAAGAANAMEDAMLQQLYQVVGHMQRQNDVLTAQVTHLLRD